MAVLVPDLIDPLNLIKKRVDLRGTVAVAALPRLVDTVLAPDGEVAWALHFGREDGVAAITGSVAAELTLQCQCCMESLLWRVDGQIRLGVVRTLEKADKLPEAYEPLLLDESSQVCLLDIIEDEVLLALPIIPQHSHACRAIPARPASATERTNPLSVLAALKKV